MSAASDVRASSPFDPGFVRVNGVGLQRVRRIHDLRQPVQRRDAARAAGSNEISPAGGAAIRAERRRSAERSRCWGCWRSRSPAMSLLTAPRVAVVAVDTDNELISARFANNTANATSCP